MKTFKQYIEMAYGKSLTTAEKKTANDMIYAITKGYHDKIPLRAVFDVLTQIGVHAVQEDGTPWSGFLVGGAECGTEEAKNQRVNFSLVRTDTKTPLNNSLFLSWCKMPSGRYEIVSYLS
jgi:hypothetical protein